jgi:hypothetical protein
MEKRRKNKRKIREEEHLKTGKNWNRLYGNVGHCAGGGK